MNPLLLAAPVAALGAAGLSAYAAVNAHSQLFGPTVRQTDAPSKLALTFDDGPNPSITPKLLDLLARHNAKASFFVIGKYVRECPGLVKEAAARGHVLGNHTDTHPNLFFCAPDETHQELLRCCEAIMQATWAEPQWFRPPFGYRSPWLSEIVHRQNMRTVMWTLLPGDWHTKPVEWLIPRLQPIAHHVQQNSQRGRFAIGLREGTVLGVPKNSRKSGVSTPEASNVGTGTMVEMASSPNSSSPHCLGDILCLHDGDYRRQNGDRARTLAALEHWLPRWRDLGLEFVTMNQAFGKVVEA